MINYYTQINMKPSFSSQMLLSVFFDWLSNSKNKMEHFVYHGESSLVYREKRKCLKIEEFKEVDTLGIQFTTSDNDKKTQFVVELMYHTASNSLDLGFYKELNADSKYIEAISIPKVFTELLHSEYVVPDHELMIQDTPRMCSRKEFQALNKQQFALPLVVLMKNQKCVVHPYVLSKRLFGLAHVICITTKNQPSMRIQYPNGEWTEMMTEQQSKMVKKCYDAVLNYSVQEHSQNYMFDELIKARLWEEKAAADELENYYEESVLVLQKEVEEYKQLYQKLFEEYQQLKQKKEALDQYVQSMDQKSILIMNDNNSQKKKLMMELIQKKLRSLDEQKSYRKRDVLNSILKENCL